MPKLYALLVGINDYDPAVGKLTGCVNDVEHLHDFLKEEFGPDDLNVEVLTDHDATRDNIIKGFASHLGRAGRDDVALFHYSGHGARWASASAFREHYPDGKDEGLVCIDSRKPGGYDLADKELAVLLERLAEKEPHIAVVFDCCHSGSGTRGVDDMVHPRPRRTHEVFQERPLDSYLDGYYAERQRAGERLTMPTSRHILLAACKRTQKAWETHDNRGVFTVSLLDALSRQGSALSYAKLFTRCRAAVRERADNQDPQFNTYADFNSNAGFLGCSTSGRARPHSISFDNGWHVDCGALHGLPTDPEKKVTLAFYPENEPDALACHAVTTRVKAHRSLVDGDFSDDVGMRYDAEITSLPVPGIPVYVSGDEAALQTLAGALEKDGSVGVELTHSPAGTRYEVRAVDDQFHLFEREPEALIQGADGYSEYAAGKILEALKGVATWERGLGIQNEYTQLETSKVEFWFAEKLADGREHDFREGDDGAPSVTLDYIKVGNTWPRIPGAIKVRNRTPQRLHMALFYFSPRYGIHPAGNEPIPPGEEEVVLWDPGDEGFELLDDEDEELNRFKLFVSTEKVDDFLLKQDRIKTGQIHPVPVKTRGARGVGGFEPSEPKERTKYQEEWFTKVIEIKTVRQADRIGTQDAALANRGIRIKGHLSVTANVSLTSARAGTRSAGSGSGIHAALERLPAPSGERQLFQLVDFGGTRSAGSKVDASVLELNDIRNADKLAEQPLEIELDVPLEDDEALLPLTFDGEFLLLGGDTYTDDAGITHVTIDHLPEIPNTRRSVGSALKLYFFRTYLKRERVNRLRWVEYRDDGTVERRDDGVAERVANAKNILLLVHGIIGGTKAMSAGVRDVVVPQGRTLDEEFDLVLTYDYENLSRPIDETAAKLKKHLEEVGLKEDDERRLTLLVHSMGGLVSRWFIEKLGGDKVVDHLVMCGTPNNGSPFGKVKPMRKILGALTTLTLNLFPGAATIGSAVVLLLDRSKKITPTLEQMSPASEFIAELNAGGEPPIPYTIIAGDIDAFDPSSEPLLGRLLDKVGKSVAFDALFGTDHHDIAVRVDSIREVDAATKNEVACHHLNYFTSQPGLKALAQVAWRGPAAGGGTS